MHAGRIAVLVLIAVLLPVASHAQERPRIAPGYGSGAVWARPLPFTPRELADALGAEPGDTAIARLIQEYVEQERARRSEERLPSWVTRIGGQQVGIDPAWIHLGPIKLPSLLLGLLPLNVQSNPQQAEQARRWAQMREMMQVQGARDAARADIEAAVNAIREERE